MRPAVVPFSAPQHLDETIAVLLEVRRADPTYPPPRDADENAASFSRWLLSPTAVARWVALIDGHVVGHVLLDEPHPYLTEHLDQVGYTSTAPAGIAEVAKLFVSPLHRRAGIGAALLETACSSAWHAGRQPALAVVITSSAAIRFYQRAGLRDVGGFVGVHGENRVLVQERPSAPMDGRESAPSPTSTL